MNVLSIDFECKHEIKVMNTGRYSLLQIPSKNLSLWEAITDPRIDEYQGSDIKTYQLDPLESPSLR